MLGSLLEKGARRRAAGWSGEQLLDWGFICSALPRAPQRALAIGCGQSPILPAMLALRYRVTAVDRGAAAAGLVSGCERIAGDFRELNLPPGFDVIALGAAAEHIGGPGAKADADDDLKTMRRIAGLLAPHGLVFLTLPVGADTLSRPGRRVYGRGRLPRLVEDLHIVSYRRARVRARGDDLEPAGVGEGSGFV